jgi:predicted DCC family thiol-disulfide oxidoreductase YuxK
MTALRTVFGCDLRTLAIFRLGLGCALLVDLVSRARDLRAHYTYFGMVPQPTGTESFFLTFIHLFIGSTWFQASVFLLVGLSAVAVVVGYRTRLATLVCWFLLLFIQSRNNFVFQGGDKLLLLLFFWGIFLPLGARYSVDAAVDETKPNEFPNHYFSMGTVAILLQVACLYFFSALLKNAPEWVPDGTAIYYALHLQSFVRPLGEWLLDFPTLLQWLTYYVWILEIIGPFLLFSPWFFVSLRLNMWIQLVALHLGIVMCLNVGLFPLFNMVSLLLFIPSWFWDRMPLFRQTSERMGLTIYFDGACDFCRKTCLLLKTFLVLPHTLIVPAQEDQSILAIMERDNTWVVQDHQGAQYTQWKAIVLLFRYSPIFWPLAGVLSLPFLSSVGTKLYQTIARNRGKLSRLTHVALTEHQDHQIEGRRSSLVEALVGILTIYMVFINLTTVPNLPMSLADPFSMVQNSLGLNQNWDMFAPSPRKWDGWYVIPGRLIDGTAVDVSRRQLKAPDIEDSSLQQYPYSSYRWRKSLQNLTAKKYQDDRKHYAGYLCRVWNESHQPLQHLLSLSVYFVKVDTPLPNDDQPPKREIMKLWEQSCLKS